mgnify:CR=1 FL=1
MSPDVEAIPNVKRFHSTKRGILNMLSGNVPLPCYSYQQRSSTMLMISDLNQFPASFGSELAHGISR